jgi:hypothetical protein
VLRFRMYWATSHFPHLNTLRTARQICDFPFKNTGTGRQISDF